MNAQVKNLPKLITVSGFTEEACQTLLNKFQENKNGIELIKLLNRTSRENTNGHKYRGYTILGEKNTTEIHRQEKRPICFFFPGYGGFWPGMGKDLLNIQPFKNSILRSAEILKPEGFNLVELIFNSTKETFSNVLETSILTAATQIGLVDMYTSLGIKPDIVLGVSIGEMACAYVDSCATQEEAILTVYSAGKILNETAVVPCLTARISLSWEETRKVSPSDVYLSSSYNGSFVLVAGRATSIQNLVHDLNSKQIKAVTIDFPIPFHTKYLAEAATKIKERLDKLIPNPKERSLKWLSTSVPESDWKTSAAKLYCADYFANSLVNPILLHETAKHIPRNAITIQVSLDNRKWQEESLKKFLPGHTGILSTANDLLCNIGKLHNAGFHLDISTLYSAANAFSSDTLITNTTF